MGCAYWVLRMGGIWVVWGVSSCGISCGNIPEIFIAEPFEQGVGIAKRLISSFHPV